MSSTTLLADTTSRSPAPGQRSTPAAYTDPNLFDWLHTATAAELDTLPFGIVAMALDGTVEHYNVAEGKLAGLTPSRVIGRNFFTAVAPCTNNFMVAHRFAEEAELDDVINYVFTLRMAPKKVHLRLMNVWSPSRCTSSSKGVSEP